MVGMSQLYTPQLITCHSSMISCTWRTISWLIHGLAKQISGSYPFLPHVGPVFDGKSFYLTIVKDMFSLLVSDPDSTKPWVISKELTLTLRFSLVNISMVDHGGKIWKTSAAKAVWLKWPNDVLYFLISDLMGQQATPCGWNKPRLVLRKWKLNIDVKGKPPYAVASRGIFPVSNHFLKMKVTWAAFVFLCSTVFFWTKCKVVSQNISGAWVGLSICFFESRFQLTVSFTWRYVAAGMG